MSTNISTNMLLPVPQVGTESGPQYGYDINSCLTLIDQHTHASGSGVPITPDALNINDAVSMAGNNLLDIRSLRFSPQGSTLSDPTDIGCLYEVTDDLYYNDGLGNQVRLTQNGAVAGTPGSIANLAAPASAAYSSGSSTFIFQSAATTAANLDAGSLVLRQITASSAGLTLSPPATLVSDYEITLPALPASTLPLSISSSGAMSAAPITLAQLVTAVQQSLMPAGAMTWYGGTSAPAGWLMCDGTAISRTTYAALYAVIGDANGAGDGSTTFNLPDGRGTFVRGVDGTRGLDPNKASRTAAASGGNTGNNVGSIQGHQFESHDHDIFRASAAGGVNANLFLGNQTGRNQVTGTTGGSETRPVNMYQNLIIKT